MKFLRELFSSMVCATMGVAPYSPSPIGEPDSVGGLASDAELLSLMGVGASSGSAENSDPEDDEDKDKDEGAEGGDEDEDEKDKDKQDDADGGGKKKSKASGLKSDVGAVRKEHLRIMGINRVCAGFPALSEKAVAEGWSVDQAQLAVYRSKDLRAKHGAPIGNPPVEVGKNLKVEGIKAALALNIGQVSEAMVREEYGADATKAAQRELHLFSKLSHFAGACCDVDGISLPRYGTSPVNFAEAAFSSYTFSEMLNSVIHLTLLSSYTEVPGTVRTLFRSLTATDFKEHKAVRLSGDLNFESVSDGGELKHGVLGEGTYRYSIDTKGRMIGLTRQDFINDNLGALLEVPRLLGRGAAKTVEKLGWSLVMSNPVMEDGAPFFSAAHNNLATGTGSALSIDALALVEEMLETQVGLDGDPILVNGKWLVVPPALRAYALQIYKSTNRGAGTGDVSENYGEANIYAGAYEPLSSPYLKSEPEAWYLWSDPSDIAAFGIAWLNGVQTPTVEEVEPRGDYLGRMWRGYIDFGVAPLDWRGAVKSAGN